MCKCEGCEKNIDSDRELTVIGEHGYRLCGPCEEFLKEDK
ncbi:hypothetical protein J2T13_000892 [Paenibacillus sp. DS2015]